MSIIALIEKYEDLQLGDACIFILRHAEKPIAKNINEDIANGITAKGKEKAAQLGRKLNDFYHKIGVIKSSPVKRCVETSQGIFSIYYQDNEVVSDTMLGDDGPYVSDSQLAAKHFLVNPAQKDIFIRMQRGEGFSGFRKVDLGTKLLLVNILQDLSNVSYPSFYITHDCILALFVNTLIDQVIDEKNWFDYLEGVGIKKINNIIKLYYNSECFDITKKVNNLFTF